AEKLAVLRAHCEKLGRNFEDIEVSQQMIGAIADSEAEARRLTEEVHQEIGFLAGSPELCPTGTPGEVIERLKKSLAMGITTFIVSFGRHASTQSLRLFGREVLPAFRD